MAEMSKAPKPSHDVQVTKISREELMSGQNRVTKEANNPKSGK